MDHIHTPLGRISTLLFLMSLSASVGRCLFPTHDWRHQNARASECYSENVALFYYFFFRFSAGNANAQKFKNRVAKLEKVRNQLFVEKWASGEKMIF